MLKDILDKGKCFKLICGAGNENIDEIEKLTAIFSSAGCCFFDVSANLDVIKAAEKGIEKSLISQNRYLCISVGANLDIHFSYAKIISDKCNRCGLCYDNCSQKAIYKGDFYTVLQEKCIGCGKCINVCNQKCIERINRQMVIEKILTPEVISYADCIEFHISSPDENDIFQKWEFINKNYTGIISICLNRQHFGDNKFKEIITKLVKSRKPYTTIIQADGNPMSGGDDSYATTLQAIASAQLVNKLNLPVYSFISGGTNIKSFQLAKLCEIDICGIGMGSFARKAVQKYINNKDFWSDEKLKNEAIFCAKEVIDKSF